MNPNDRSKRPTERSSLAEDRSRRSRALSLLTMGHVIGTGTLSYLIWEVSEQNWLGSALTFLPRWPWLLPGIWLLLLSLWKRSRAAWVNAAVLLASLVVIGGFNVPWRCLVTSANQNHRSSHIVRLVSTNVQNFAPDFRLLLREIVDANPDVIALQEAFKPPSLLAEQFPDWHVVHVRGYWVGSRWPLKLLGQCDSDVYQRETAMVVDVAAPWGTFSLANVHLMTARKSLRLLTLKSIATGTGPQSVNEALAERSEEARQTRSFINATTLNRPTLICGDFNMPTSSSIYRVCFGDFQNTFETSCCGFGYTAPCRPISFWPRNSPWQRIDHIASDSRWAVTDCHIGEHDGSDHRLISATLRLLPNSTEETSSNSPVSAVPDLSEEVNALQGAR